MISKEDKYLILWSISEVLRNNKFYDGDLLLKAYEAIPFIIVEKYLNADECESFWDWIVNYVKNEAIKEK